MDYLIASDQAKLSMRFVKMGLVPELASSHFLASRLGFGNASELMLSGKTIMATEAKEIGLVDRVTSQEELVPVAIEVARGMGDNPLASVRHIKKLLTANASDSDLKAVQKREMEALKNAMSRKSTRKRSAPFLKNVSQISRQRGIAEKRFSIRSSRRNRCKDLERCPEIKSTKTFAVV